MKSIDVYGLGNAILDIQVPVGDDVLSALSFSPGSSELVAADRQKLLMDGIAGLQSQAKLSAGGSVGNSVITVTELSGTSAFSSRLGDDNFGIVYKDDFDRLKVTLGNPLVIGGTTGTSVVLITPDGERTMRTHLGVCADMSESDIQPALLKQARWLFVEGYIFANGPQAQDAITKAIDMAQAPSQRDRTSVALTLSDKGIVRGFKAEILKALEKTDLLFANKSEAMALTGAASLDKALECLETMVPHYVVTSGPDGAFLRAFGQEAHVPTVKVTPIDTTGAGDTFAGGVIYGITNGYSAVDSVKGGNFLASKVIQQYGARLAGGVKDAWDEGLSK